MKDIINNRRKSGEWKIQLIRSINFISSKNNEESVMYSKTNNIELMIYDNTDEVIEEVFGSLLNIYQMGLETSMRVINFVFNCVLSLYYKFHKINKTRGGSYIASPDWIKNKNVTINPIDKKDKKCFQYTVTVT